MRKRGAHRFGRAGLVAGLLCASLGFNAPDARSDEKPQKTASETWYAESFNKGERGFVVTYFWSRGAKLRSEMVIRGHRVVTLVNGEFYYAIDELTGSGVAIRRVPGAIRADATRGRPFAQELARILEDGGEKIGIDRVGSVECDLYRATDRLGRRRVCVTQTEPRLPIHVEIFNRRSGRTDSVDYANWMSGLEIPDEFFEPASSLKLERLEYDEYLKRSRQGKVGPVPVLYGPLLHGAREH